MTRYHWESPLDCDEVFIIVFMSVTEEFNLIRRTYLPLFTMPLYDWQNSSMHFFPFLPYCILGQRFRNSLSFLPRIRQPEIKFELPVTRVSLSVIFLLFCVRCSSNISLLPLIGFVFPLSPFPPAFPPPAGGVSLMHQLPRSARGNS